MKASSEITSKTKRHSPGAYVPKIDVRRATLQETDEWIRALGGQAITGDAASKIVGEVKWANIPDENPGDPEFPLAMYLDLPKVGK